MPCSPLDSETGMPIRRSRPYGTFGLVACAALGVTLAACSGGGPTPTAADVAHVARSGLVQGGTLRWAVDAAPTTFNVFQTDATEGSTLVTEAVLPTLFTLDEHAVATPDADYLTGVQQTSQQPQTVVYHLNPKALWSDGRPLSAADFSAQWKALSGRDSAYWTARTDGYDSIADVRQGSTALDVQVTFSKPYASWKRLFSPLYPAAAMGDAGAFNDGSRTRLAADSGPFTLKTLNGGTVTVVRNPHWWGTPAKLDAIAFTPVAPAARTAALRAGQLDIADLSTAVEDGGSAARSQAGSVPGVTLHRASAPGYLQLTFNGGSGPLADPDLRRAVAQAVDRVRIADAVLKPLGLPAVPLGNHLVMADQNGYQDDSSALAASADNATRHLDAAGWRLGKALPASTGTAGVGGAGAAGAAADAARASGSAVGGASGSPAPGAGSATTVRTKDGRPLGLTLLTRAGSSLDAQVADLLTAQLDRVGVPLRTRAVPGDSYFADHVSTGDFDLALFSWPASRYPVADERPLFAKPQVGPDGSLINGQNLADTGTDEVDRLLADASTALNPKDAARLISEADTRIWQEAPSLPLFQQPELVAVRDDVGNAGAFGFATPRFQDLGFTHA
ncbi:peptide/nickel transport system substrate-binding protein [Streptacidiphilus sp. MAP12-16]|uniref:ABC transporter family substrate-binding protein n=1 Tax=Streptacidiphilus sp. MAP12-16 TaxID=3156300 RepID=UPI00351186B4